MARALVSAPKTARRGETIEIKVLIQHPMETGYRPGPSGEILPRDIVNRLTCTYNGAVVIDAELFPAMSANPYLAFSTVATDSGAIVLTWSGDNNFRHTESLTIEVA